MTANIESAGCPVDIEEAEKQASEDVVAQREEALAKQLQDMRRRKKRLVDPLQFEMSIQGMSRHLAGKWHHRLISSCRHWKNWEFFRMR